MMPSVGCSRLKTKQKKMTTLWCQGDSIPAIQVKVAKPILRDGLWMTDISVPMIINKSSFNTIREQFEIQVQFKTSKVKGIILEKEL
jgi:hypothetical protein